MKILGLRRLCHATMTICHSREAMSQPSVTMTYCHSRGVNVAGIDVNVAQFHDPSVRFAKLSFVFGP